MSPGDSSGGVRSSAIVAGGQAAGAAGLLAIGGINSNKFREAFNRSAGVVPESWGLTSTAISPD
ncbi:hypothetical protein ACYOEI_06395 [Singulisphaera rosea]